MFGMDDYTACKKDNGLYCKFTFRLVPDSTDNLVWQTIQVCYTFILNLLCISYTYYKKLLKAESYILLAPIYNKCLYYEYFFFIIFYLFCSVLLVMKVMG